MRQLGEKEQRASNGGWCIAFNKKVASVKHTIGSKTYNDKYLKYSGGWYYYGH